MYKFEFLILSIINDVAQSSWFSIHSFNLMHLLLSKKKCVEINDKPRSISLLMMNEIKNEKKKLETFSFGTLFVTIH